MPLSRRGLTLVELVVALTLLGVVAAAAYRMIAGNQRTYRAETQRIDRQQNLRAAASILPAELRELDATDGDILAMSATSITLRAMRQLAILCDAPPPGGGTSLTVRQQPFFGVRDFEPATDSLLIYSDDAWVPARLATVTGGTCADGAPGRVLAVQLAPHAGPIPEGAPVRGFEIVTYRLYRASDGQWQIGLLEGGAAAIQPLVGPVADNGLELTYLDSAGAPTGLPARVATIEIRLRAATAEPVRSQDGRLERLMDSIVTVVALRNNRRS